MTLNSGELRQKGSCSKTELNRWINMERSRKRYRDSETSSEIAVILRPNSRNGRSHSTNRSCHQDFLWQLIGTVVMALDWRIHRFSRWLSTLRLHQLNAQNQKQMSKQACKRRSRPTLMAYRFVTGWGHEGESIWSFSLSLFRPLHSW